jgi:NADH-quinone oxidoreductase subunit N
MTPAYESIGVLVLGAIVVLLLVTWIGPNARAASLTALPFAVVAAALGLQAPPPIALAIVALGSVCAIALLLLEVLEPEVPLHVAEAAALLLLGTAGAVALASATDLLQAVVGLETLALSAVILVALGAGDRALEAAFKYFVLGAISLAGLLYGVGLVYLGSGSLAFPTAAQVAASPLTLAGVVLVGLGLAFELALAPLHWGALDAYTAAAPSLAGFVMSASKLAAAFALGRLVLAAGFELSQILVWVGSLTIAWGTFGALSQAANLRRMLAYSAITHAGFIGLALGSGASGPTTAVFYAAVYGSMAMLVFAALAGQSIEGLRQIGRFRALALALGLFSLSGIPPTPGFWAKLAVLVVAWQAAGPVPTLIAVAGGVFSVLYYLRPLPDLFAAIRGDEVGPRPVQVPGILLATLAVVVLGLFPGVAWFLARGA